MDILVALQSFHGVHEVERNDGASDQRPIQLRLSVHPVALVALRLLVGLQHPIQTPGRLAICFLDWGEARSFQLLDFLFLPQRGLLLNFFVVVSTYRVSHALP